MFRNILVPLDGSTVAEQALPRAEHLARLSKATIHLVRVVELPTTWVAGPMDGSLSMAVRDIAESAADRSKVAQNYLRTVAARLTRAGLSVRIGEFEGAIVPTLVAYARQTAIDLVVIRGQQSTGPARLVFGSVIDGIIRQSPAPVLVVHPTDEPAPLTGILVPLDGSIRAEQAVPIALRLTPFFAREVELVRVIRAVGEAPAAVRYLADAASRLVRGRAQCSQRVAMGDVVDTIVELAGTERLVVMAGKEHTGLLSVLRHSVAARVAHASLAATLVLCPGHTSADAAVPLLWPGLPATHRQGRG